MTKSIVMVVKVGVSNLCTTKFFFEKEREEGQ